MSDIIETLEEYAKDWRTRANTQKPTLDAIAEIKRLRALSIPNPTEGQIAGILREWLWAKKRVIGEGRDSREDFDVMGINEAATRIAALRSMPLQDHAKRLREVLTPFVEIARRLDWDKIEDDDMALGEHVIEAPADDIAPGAVYCLMIGAFREAARAMVAEDGSKS